MHGRRALEHCLARDLPKETLAQRLLRHAPRIQRAEWPDDVWNTGVTTSTCSHDGRMVKDRVNVGQGEVSDVRVEPSGQRSPVFEPLAPLRKKEPCAHPFVLKATSVGTRQSSIGRYEQDFD